MLAGTRKPFRAGRAHRLTAVVAAAACWLVVPAGASAQQEPALDVSGLTNAATGAVAATGSAVEDTVTAAAPLTGPAQETVTQVAGTVARVTGPDGPVARLGEGTADATGSVVERVTGPAAPVAGVADRVVQEARRTVDKTLPAAGNALEGATGTARDAVRDSGTASAPVGQGSPRVERLTGPAAGGENSRASRLRLGGTVAAERPFVGLPAAPDKPASSILTPLIPGPPIVPGMPAGGGDAGSAAAGSGSPEPPSEPLPGAAGGSSAAGAFVSFSLGGLALLLATLSLAGPALRRRLPRRPVIGWPAAFVPLLERPG
jgi:hypothetical protein